MKKFFAGMIAALLLAATMSTTVFAAGSLSPNSQTLLRADAETLNRNVSATKTITAANGQSVSVTQSSVSQEQLSAGYTKAQETYGSSVAVLAMTDLSIPAGTVISQNGVAIQLQVSGVLAGDNIRVLHQTATGWEELTPQTVENGSITVVMTSFSPVTIVRVADSSAGSSGTANPSTGTTGSGTTTPASVSNQPVNTTSSNSPDNSQTNNQNNPVNVNQNVNVNYPDSASTYSKSSNSTKAAGTTSTVKSSSSSRSGTKGSTKGSTGSSNGGSSASTTSPKTGASLPALPILAVFVFAGILVCGKKARNQ
jgi:hypothetical protein